jgi:ankyrin repeat protein
VHNTASMAGGIHTGQPLHAAATKGFLELVRLLLAHHADPEAIKTDGSTPLSLAAKFGRPGVIGVLLSAGARVGKPPQSLSP